MASKNKFVKSRLLEINVAYHCNLRCKACSHFSPISDVYFVDYKKLSRELSILAKSFRADFIELEGGEALLHPDLLNVIKAARNCGISSKIRVSTNGTNLTKISGDIWKNVDEFMVSNYRNRIKKSDINAIKRIAKTYNTRVVFLDYIRFRIPYSEKGTGNKKLIKRIYKTCQIAHLWKCYTFDNGYFYKCPLAIFIPKHLGKYFKYPHIDGLKVNGTLNFQKKLQKYLNSKTPLNSCKYCLGTVGNLIKHSQCKPKLWRKIQNHKTEDLVDILQLRIIENFNPREDPMCLKMGSDINS